VDDQDLQIVKTYGKAVPDYRRRNEENLFPRFETYRENIDGKYWFPTYTRADDILHFKNDDIRIAWLSAIPTTSSSSPRCGSSIPSSRSLHRQAPTAPED